MNKLRAKLNESMQSVLPIASIVIVLSCFLVPMPSATLLMFLAGSVMLVVGMGLFSLGADMSMMPMGEAVGRTVMASRKLFFSVLICFLIGAFTTIAEPDLQVLATQVTSVPGSILIMMVSVGVGLFLVVAMLRPLFKIKLAHILLILYAVIFVLLAFIPDNFVSIAFDAGGVTTGPITVPFIMSLGVGLASLAGSDSTQEDSFGLVSLCSVGPIIAVMLLAIIYTPKDVAASAEAVVVSEGTTFDIALSFIKGLPDYLREVSFALLPVIVFFAIFQFFFKLFRRGQLLRVIVGLFYTFSGLIIFLTGVNIGFSPAGQFIGGTLGKSPHSWILVPLGALFGYFIVNAEPAIHVLNKQVEDITGGSVSRGAMHVSLALGVSCAIGLSMLRAISGISLLWIVVPGYAIALGLTFFVPPIFTGIAFDSGGVASGPMAATFLLPLAIGACEGAGKGSVMECAFGLVSLVALTPLISIQILGLLYKLKTSRGETYSAPALDRFEIIDYEEYAK